MPLATERVDMTEERDRLQEKRAEAQADLDEVVAEASELMPVDPSDEEGQERLAELHADHDEYEAAVSAVGGYIDVIETHLAEWRGSEFVFQELSAAQARQLRDSAEREATRRGFEDVPQGYLELEQAKAFLTETPAGAPDPADVGDLPDRLFNWVYSRGSSLNTVGSTDLGNSSLEERVAEHRRSD